MRGLMKFLQVESISQSCPLVDFGLICLCPFQRCGSSSKGLMGQELRHRGFYSSSLVPSSVIYLTSLGLSFLGIIISKTTVEAASEICVEQRKRRNTQRQCLCTLWSWGNGWKEDPSQFPSVFSPQHLSTLL